MKKLFSTTLLAASLLSSAAFAGEKAIPLTGHDKATNLFSEVDRNPPQLLDFWVIGFGKHALIETVNSEYNHAIKYKEEPKGEDIWQHPNTTITKGTGDCEDYAIAKWAHLKAKGIPESSMRFVNGTYDGIFHLYLKVTIDGAVYHLDNNSNNTSVSPIKPENVLYEMDEHNLYLNVRD